MSTFTRTVEQTFHVVACYTCGTNFGINDGMYRRAVRDKKGSVYCPACGSSTCWTGETQDQKRARLAEEQLQRERAQHDQTKAELSHTENQRRAEKAAKTRLKNRVAHGVCPCCNRTFQNLAQHMANQHPEYAGNDQ
ncbi:MAG: hypothetical protein ACIAQU_04185 [Phycisphaerales bacterium JB064]